MDAFVTRPVIPEQGYFDDHADPGQVFWGLYGVMPVGAVPGLHVDLYYLGLDRQNAIFDSGTANETRHSLGTRLWGQSGAWDYDTEGVLQFGEFGSRDIRAWTLASNIGYTVKGLWGEPRLGLQVDAASGAVRLSLLHYNSPAEVTGVIAALDQILGRAHHQIHPIHQE